MVSSATQKTYGKGLLTGACIGREGVLRELLQEHRAESFALSFYLVAAVCTMEAQEALDKDPEFRALNKRHETLYATNKDKPCRELARLDDQIGECEEKAVAKAMRDFGYTENAIAWRKTPLIAGELYSAGCEIARKLGLV